MHSWTFKLKCLKASLFKCSYHGITYVHVVWQPGTCLRYLSIYTFSWCVICRLPIFWYICNLWETNVHVFHEYRLVYIFNIDPCTRYGNIRVGSKFIKKTSTSRQYFDLVIKLPSPVMMIEYLKIDNAQRNSIIVIRFCSYRLIGARLQLKTSESV